jgi:hypothetical protein
VKTKKAARKPAAPQGTVPGRPFVAGDPRINRTKPGPGRPRNEFKAWCAEVLDKDVTRKQVEKIMKNGNHRAFKSMFSELADRAYGKANQDVAVSGTLTLEQILTRSREIELDAIPASGNNGNGNGHNRLISGCDDPDDPESTASRGKPSAP